MSVRVSTFAVHLILNSRIVFSLIVRPARLASLAVFQLFAGDTGSLSVGFSAAARDFAISIGRSPSYILVVISASTVLRGRPGTSWTTSERGAVRCSRLGRRGVIWATF